MPNIARMVASVVTWMAFALAMIYAKPQNSGDTVTFTAILAVMALLSMVVIWREAGANDARQNGMRMQGSEPNSKAKRSERRRVSWLANTLDNLDDDEAAALLSELKARMALQDDGEAVSLEDLLVEREQEKTGRE